MFDHNLLINKVKWPKFIKCQQSCTTTRYGYSSTSISCTKFCRCEAVTGVCCNKLTFLTNANDRNNEKGV